jgi:hypothetical protein
MNPWDYALKLIYFKCYIEGYGRYEAIITENTEYESFVGATAYEVRGVCGSEGQKNIPLNIGQPILSTGGILRTDPRIPGADGGIHAVAGYPGASGSG